jgi:hypothetical protein
VKPFLILSIITLAMVAGGVRLASNKNHWEDVAVGFSLGAMIAIYLVNTIWLIVLVMETCLLLAISDENASIVEDHCWITCGTDGTL